MYSNVTAEATGGDAAPPSGRFTPPSTGGAHTDQIGGGSLMDKVKSVLK